METKTFINLITFLVTACLVIALGIYLNVQWYLWHSTSFFICWGIHLVVCTLIGINSAIYFHQTKPVPFHIHSDKGFTLIEILLFTAVVAALLLVVIVLL